MSATSTFKNAFKNFGHAIASGAKYLQTAVLDVVKVATKVETAAPEVEAVIGAIAGPQAEAFTDLGFHLLGDFANALQTVDNDALQAVSEKGLVVTTDLATIQAVKAAAAVIQNVINATGTAIPAPTPAPAVPATPAV